ncbi:MAG: hypothetical protein RJA49_1567 [Actinomycetota bacterium]
MTSPLRRVLALGLLAGLALAPAVGARADGPSVAQASATVNVAANTVTLPLFEGRGPDGTPTWYVVINASNSSAASKYRVDVVNKLRNAGAGAQAAHFVNGLLTFEGGVDFTPVHRVQGSATGFPPLAADPGSRGDAKYSPLVRLPDGTVLNAPQIGNISGWHDKVVSIDVASHRVTLALTAGFARDHSVLYLSTDATDPGVAALEGSTFAPRLGQAPRAGDDSTNSARASLAAFLNGPTGVDNPQRQGVNSALLGEGSPLNVLAWGPGQGRYSPLWDVHLSVWANPAQAHRVIRFADVEDLARSGAVVGAGGGAWVANDIIVDCPIIATL